MVKTGPDFIRLTLLVVTVAHILLQFECSALPTRSDLVNGATASGPSYHETLQAAHNQASYEAQYCTLFVEINPMHDTGCEGTNQHEPTVPVVAVIAGFFHIFKVRTSDEDKDHEPASPERFEEEDSGKHFQTGKWRNIAIAVAVVIVIFVSIWFSALAWKCCRNQNQPTANSVRHPSRRHPTPTSRSSRPHGTPSRQTAIPIPQLNIQPSQSVDTLPVYTPSDNGSSMNLPTATPDTDHPGHTIAAPGASTASPPSYVTSQEQSTQRAGNNGPS